eukprot:Gregarina_sp_Poly_1__6938@NODE_3771_length_889_cov_5_682482_g2422_i0_p2_GENE_NODE_3771_length_889_cov_5_682482_g2422_i0NODE_3771_length_889_cov_5_682482_g2422_i0_p2_ORF_typecomplete_len163_score21_76Pkinase/PF00069_25/2_6e28Pkinase_Tyr/PF07714_17/2_1e18Phage_int_SAM_1/PF02899_17/3_2e02Phage_int_SAM_1/PF02899_17/1_NODE_3771_length_889_cov_5_682482_g2422_i0277765
MHKVVKKIWNKVSSRSGEDALSEESARNNSISRYTQQNLQFIRTVGTGSFGRVFVSKVKDPSAEIVAVKRLTKHTIIKQKQVAHVLAEKAILSSVDHPFIVKLLNTYRDNWYLYIVLEFVQGGEFFTYLRKVKRLSIDSAKFYAAQVTSIFEYLHSGDIVYR